MIVSLLYQLSKTAVCSCGQAPTVQWRSYNEHRPHQARHQRPPNIHRQLSTTHQVDTRKSQRNRILGGLINEYRYAA
jgi:hypothetical protein